MNADDREKLIAIGSAALGTELVADDGFRLRPGVTLGQMVGAVVDAFGITHVPMTFMDDNGVPWPNPPQVPPFYRIAALEVDL